MIGFLQDCPGIADVKQTESWIQRLRTVAQLQLVDAIATLVSVEAEVSHSLSSTNVASLPTVERAFVHLQRSIALDSAYRGKWRAAFEAQTSSGRSVSEIRCEEIGALHLLSHGLWCFKANAPDQRTDLVLGHGELNDENVRHTGAVLVLTEWKSLRSKGLTEAIHEARSQIEIYSMGILGGFELSSHRFGIIVSEKEERLPDDVSYDGWKLRWINVAIEPTVPSSRS